MKKVKIAYWVTTGLISLMMLISGYGSLNSEQVKASFVHLGFPGSFRIELAIAKFLGVITLLLPAAKGRVKEWAYFGFFITFVSAFIAHFTVGDPADKWSIAVVCIAVLLASYFFYRKLQGQAKVA